MFVLNPDPYLLPCYRISPFQTKDISANNYLQESNSIDDYFNERFKDREYHYVTDGRKAINIALQQYSLQKDDVVTIFTSSGNFYISSCVTSEIEKFCKWSRQVEKNTKLIFVNHEFGYPYKQTAALKNYGLPVVEDCCHSFFSVDKENSMGATGDFAIYSFPKMFPLQIGGLLTAKKSSLHGTVEKLQHEKLRYIKNVLSYYISGKDDIISKRIENYNYLKNKLHQSGFKERFQLQAGVVPGVFMFTIKDEAVDLPLLKNYLYARGIQCSVFYGERSFFIPVHQNLVKPDLDYFIEAISSFVK